MTCWAIFDLASVWPYNASNAAVPLAAVFLGHLPQTDGDRALVKGLGFIIFLLAFVPLIFGGTVYRMLEKIMTAKLVLVLGYLSLIAVTLVSWPVIRDVWTGFFRVGTVPLRAQTIILERDFTIQQEHGGSVYRAQGTWEKDGKPTGEFSGDDRAQGRSLRPAKQRQADSPERKEIRDRLLDRVRELADSPGVLRRDRGERNDARGRRRNREPPPLEAFAPFAARFDRHARLLATSTRFPSLSRAGFATCSRTKGSNMSVS